jgi:hypothetical protein
VRTLEIVEAVEATTSVRDAERADVGETKGIGKEKLPGQQTGQEEPFCQPPQHQKDERLLELQLEAERHEPRQPKGPASEVEQEVVVSLPAA